MSYPYIEIPSSNVIYGTMPNSEASEHLRPSLTFATTKHSDTPFNMSDSELLQEPQCLPYGEQSAITEVLTSSDPQPWDAFFKFDYGGYDGEGGETQCVSAHIDNGYPQNTNMGSMTFATTKDSNWTETSFDDIPDSELMQEPRWLPDGGQSVITEEPASDLQHCEAAYNLSNGEWDGPIDETRCVSTYNDTNHPQYTGIVWEFNHPVSHAAVSENMLPGSSMPLVEDGMMFGDFRTEAWQGNSTNVLSSFDLPGTEESPNDSVSKAVHQLTAPGPGAGSVQSTSATPAQGFKFPPPSLICRIENCGIVIDNVGKTGCGIQKHIKDVHPYVLQTLTCDGKTACPWGHHGDRCGSNIAVAGLGRHIASVHEKFTYCYCTHCGAEVSRSDARLRHMRRDCPCIPKEVRKHLNDQRKVRSTGPSRESNRQNRKADLPRKTY